MNLERVKRIKEEIKKTVKSKKRTLPDHKDVEKEIEQQATDRCDKITDCKNAAQIEEIIQKKLLNDPVLAYAKQRKSSEGEMKKKWNELVYITKKKTLLLESLEVQKVGLDKVLKRYAKRKANLDFLIGQNREAAEKQTKEKDYTQILGFMLRRDQMNRKAIQKPYEEMLEAMACKDKEQPEQVEYPTITKELKKQRKIQDEKLEYRRNELLKVKLYKKLCKEQQRLFQLEEEQKGKTSKEEKSKLRDQEKENKEREKDIEMRKMLEEHSRKMQKLKQLLERTNGSVLRQVLDLKIEQEQEVQSSGDDANEAAKKNMSLVETDLKRKTLQLQQLKKKLIEVKEEHLKKLSKRDQEQDGRRKYPPSMDYSQRARKEDIKTQAMRRTHFAETKNYGDDNLLGKLQ